MNHPSPPIRFAPCLVTVIAMVMVLAGCGSEPKRHSLGVAGPSTFGIATGPGREFGSPLGDYLAGTYALDTGRLEEAAGFFERALAAEPDDPDLLRQVYLLALAGGRYDEAIELAERVIQLDPNDEDAQLLLALEEARDGEFTAASESLQGFDDRGVAGLAAPFLDAWAIFGQGGPDAAERSRVRLDEGEPLGPLSTYHGAMLLDLDGRLDEAEEMLQTSMPESGAAPVRLVQAQASMLARQGDLDRARELVRTQLAQRPDQPLLEETLAELEAGRAPAPPITDATGGMADALFGIAQALYQERGGPRAVLYARLALFMKPDMAEATLLIGDTYSDQQNYEAAIETYRSIDDDSPLSYAGKLRVANALHQLERKDEAFELLEELADAEPERIEALVELGNLLRRDELYARAEKAYSRAIARLGPPDPEDWTLFYARGIAYERTKRWPEAEADFLQALDLEPEQPFVLNYLGYSWVDMGMNLDQARGMLNRAVEARPNDGYIVDSLGWVHYRLGEYPQAVDSLERAVELEPGDPVINDHLGDAYWRVGRQREARYQWERALTLEPDEDLVEVIEKKLESGLPAPDRA